MKKTSHTNKKKELAKSIEKSIEKKLKRDKKALQRHPVLFGFLGTFGLVAVFVGLEEIIRQIPYLYNNPYMLTLFGVIILFFTGALYRLLEG